MISLGFLILGCAPSGTDEAVQFQKNELVITGNAVNDLRQNIVVPHCMSCHNYHSDWANSDDAFLKWIKPGDPNGSQFFTRVISGNMPKGRAKLSQDLIDFIAQAITDMEERTPPPKKETLYERVQKNFFGSSCTACHKADEPGFLIYDDVNFVYFDTNKANADYILSIVEESDPKKYQMPPTWSGHPKPSAEAIKDYKEWVSKGFP